jgi:glycosyltransferase involved in cell wall biosynthesis
MKIAIIIPCYNEAGSIADFITSLHQIKEQYGLDLTPIVINDCSTDQTEGIIQSLDCIVLNLPVNLGIGGAVQTGFRYALQNGFDWAIQMDGDGQHPATELPNIISSLQQSNADVVIGSRFLRRQGFQSTALRRVGIRWFCWMLRWLTHNRITDPTSGFRILNRRAMQIVDTYYPNEYPEPEILVHFLFAQLTVREVPVSMEARKSGESSIHHWKSVYYMLKVTSGILFSHFRLKVYGKH